MNGLYGERYFYESIAGRKADTSSGKAISTFNEAKWMCLNQPLCKGIVQNSGGFTLRQGIVEVDVTTQDSHGWLIGELESMGNYSTYEECKNECDQNLDCISFELGPQGCLLSTSCTPNLATPLFGTDIYMKK
eukprot:Awhi_evm1s8196